MKPFVQARLLRDFCDFYSPVSNTWQSLMKYQQRKKQKFPGKNFRVFFQIHFGDQKKELVYNTTDIDGLTSQNEATPFIQPKA